MLHRLLVSAAVFVAPHIGLACEPYQSGPIVISSDTDGSAASGFVPGGSAEEFKVTVSTASINAVIPGFCGAGGCAGIELSADVVTIESSVPGQVATASLTCAEVTDPDSSGGGGQSPGGGTTGGGGSAPDEGQTDGTPDAGDRVEPPDGTGGGQAPTDGEDGGLDTGAFAQDLARILDGDLDLPFEDLPNGLMSVPEVVRIYREIGERDRSKSTLFFAGQQLSNMTDRRGGLSFGGYGLPQMDFPEGGETLPGSLKPMPSLGEGQFWGGLSYGSFDGYGDATSLTLGFDVPTGQDVRTGVVFDYQVGSYDGRIQVRDVRTPAFGVYQTVQRGSLNIDGLIGVGRPSYELNGGEGYDSWRYLASGSVSGHFDHGIMTIRPTLSYAGFSERLPAVATSAAGWLPERTVSELKVSAGAGVTFNDVGGTGLNPYVSITADTVRQDDGAEVTRFNTSTLDAGIQFELGGLFLGKVSVTRTEVAEGHSVTTYGGGLSLRF